jgi:prepilin-type N-terminal cleavage/methylation domain-containing protein
MSTVRALRRRASRRDQRGFTTVELLVAMGIMGLLLGLVGSLMISGQNSVVREQLRDQTLSDARQAMANFDREIRSGSLLYNPASENTASPLCGGYACSAGTSLRVYTQSNATTRPVSTGVCDQWTISGGQLLWRYWVPGATSSVDGWHVIATGLLTSSPTPSQLTLSGTRTISIQLKLNANSTDTRSQTVYMQSAISIRNYALGDPCTPIPSNA